MHARRVWKGRAPFDPLRRSIPLPDSDNSGNTSYVSTLARKFEQDTLLHEKQSVRNYLVNDPMPLFW